MNKIQIAVTGVLAAVSLSSVVQAQDAPKLMPVEMWTCDFQDGKNMADLDKVNQKFKKWSEKHEPTYSAWVITPQFRAMEDGFDVGWIGSWADGNAMGKGVDTWMASDDRGISDDFDAVLDCENSHVLMSSMTLHAADGPPNDGLVMFSSCTLEEDGTHEAAIEAHKKAGKAMRDKGVVAQSWLFYPTLGSGKLDFDYYQVTTFKDYSALGNTFEVFNNQGGWMDRQKAMKGIVSCDIPRVYDAKQVRAGSR